jgi:hypothetical protein
MADAEQSKDRERSRSPIAEESNPEDTDSSMTTSDGELEGEVESMDDSEAGRKADGKDPEKKPRPFRIARSSRGVAANRERGDQNRSNEDIARERQQRLLNLLLPPWMRLGASRWAAGGIASHTSRSSGSGAVKRIKREAGASDEEEEEEEEEGEKSKAVFERKFFWTCSKDTGFPHRVNHAVAGHRSGCMYMYMYMCECKN